MTIRSSKKGKTGLGKNPVFKKNRAAIGTSGSDTGFRLFFMRRIFPDSLKGGHLLNSIDKHIKLGLLVGKLFNLTFHLFPCKKLLSYVDSTILWPISDTEKMTTSEFAGSLLF